VNRADLMAAQGAFGTNFYDRYILRPKHRAYYRSGRPVIKIGPKGALGSHEIRPIHSAPSFGQSRVASFTHTSDILTDSIILSLTVNTISIGFHLRNVGIRIREGCILLVIMGMAPDTTPRYK